MDCNFKQIERDNYKVILENKIKVWNKWDTMTGYPELEYSNVGSKNGLKIKGEGNSTAIYCTKSQAIDILEFVSMLERYRQESDAGRH